MCAGSCWYVCGQGGPWLLLRVCAPVLRGTSVRVSCVRDHMGDGRATHEQSLRKLVSALTGGYRPLALLGYRVSCQQPTLLRCLRVSCQQPTLLRCLRVSASKAAHGRPKFLLSRKTNALASSAGKPVCFTRSSSTACFSQPHLSAGESAVGYGPSARAVVERRSTKGHWR